MEKLKIALAILFGAALVGCGGFTKGKPVAEKAVAKFHELYNGGKLEDIWKEADPQFRAAATKQKFDDLMGAVQRKLGKVASTSNTGWNIKTYRWTPSFGQEDAGIKLGSQALRD